MRWFLEKRKISDLKPHPNNPRKLSKHDYENLKKSIERFGLIDKPIINRDGTIIGGHQRLEVLKKEKATEVECYVAETLLTKEEEKELNIRLNRNVGEWDFEILANQWDTQDLLEWGFTEEELNFEVEDLGTAEEDQGLLEPGRDEDSISRVGDVFELDCHRLGCGDSTDPLMVQKVLNGHEPILMVTDPPYGVEYDPNWRTAAGKGQRSAGKVQNDDRVNWALAWSLFPGSVAYIWHAGKFCSEVQKSLQEATFQIINQIIWVKQHFALSRGDYHWQHEPCWYAVKEGAGHNWQGARDQSTVWEIASLNGYGANQEDERTAHSTQKPLECMSRPILNNTAKGEEVYDPFLGSGTTLIAADHLNRICYGLELSPAYCDIIIKRWISSRKKSGKDATVKRNGEVCKDFDEK